MLEFVEKMPSSMPKKIQG